MTIPNLITIMRLLLVPAVLLGLLGGHVQAAFFAFVVAGVSDGVDGFIARRFNQRSALGAYLDPLADKALLVSVFVALAYLGRLPLWIVLVIVSRDALIVCAVVLSSVMAHPVSVSPVTISKVTTAAQIMLAGVVLAEMAFALSLGPALTGLIFLTGALTVASAAAYLVGWLRHMSGYGDTPV